MSDLVYIVIPAKDEGSRIEQVVRGVRQLGYEHIIVVNDGSQDQTRHRAEAAGAEVVSHLVNLGPGAATKTGIECALEKGADYIVTLDGDGQHYPEDIPGLLDVLQQEDLDAVLGSRFKHPDNDIPRSRLVLNRLGNVFTALITGLWVSDSQSGMKAFRAEFGAKLDFQFSGYEFCTEFIHLVRHHRATYREIPIRVHYSKETMTKGQSVRNGFQMVLQFIREFV